MADALNRLDCEENTPQMEAFITDEMCSDWYCYAKEEKTYDSHPLSYDKLEKAQQVDKQLLENLNMDRNNLYHTQFFQGDNKMTYLSQSEVSCSNSSSEACD